MQDGTFKQRKGRNETGHNLTSTFNAHIKQGQSIMQFTGKKSKTIRPTKAMFKHLTRFYLTDWRHKHTYKSPKKRRTSLVVAVESSSHDRRRGRAWPRLLSRSASSLRHSSPKRAGPPHHRRCRISHPCILGQAARQTASAGPRREELRKKTQTPKGSCKKTQQRRRLRKVRPVRPFVARGSAPSLRPVLCSTSLRGVSRTRSKGACPHSDRLAPSIHQSGLSCPTPSLLTKRVGIQAEAPGREIQAGDSLSGPSKNI